MSSAISTAGRPNVPVWPLAICAVLFVAGGVLFAFRTPDERQPIPEAPRSSAISDEPTSHGDVPQDIAKFFEGNTDIQAQKLLEAHYGKRIRITGHIDNIGVLGYSRADVRFKEYRSHPLVEMIFSDKKVVKTNNVNATSTLTGSAAGSLLKIPNISTPCVGADPAPARSRGTGHLAQRCRQRAPAGLRDRCAPAAG